MTDDKPNLGLLGKLSEARKDFHEAIAAGAIKQSGYNDFSMFRYYEMRDIVPHAMDLLRKHGLATTPMTVNAHQVSMDLVDLETGEALQVAIPLSSAKLKASHEVQNQGAVLTYSRRYLWFQIMEVVEQDVVDRSEGAEAPLKPTSPATDAQWDRIKGAIAEGKMPEKTKTWLDSQLDQGKGLTLQQASAIIDRLQIIENKPYTIEQDIKEGEE